MPRFSHDIVEHPEPAKCPSTSNSDAISIASAIESAVGSFLKRIRLIEEGEGQLQAGLKRIEAKLDAIGSVGSQTTNKEWYTPAEAAELVGKKVYTVREWCRLRRINARKRQIGRGEADEWEISAQEIERYKNHGLLPIPLKY